MTELWQSLLFECGSAFGNQFGEAGGPVFLAWAKDLAGFTEKQLVRGFENFKRSDSTFLSLKVFRNHCQPRAQDFGVGPIERSAAACIKGDWSALHPAFQIVCRDHDLYGLRKLEAEKALRRFKPIYDEVLQRVASGEDFERIPMLKGPTNAVPELTERDRKAGAKAMTSILSAMGARP